MYCYNFSNNPGHCTIEFCPGKSTEKFKNERSVFVEDDTMIWFDYGLCNAIRAVLPHFDEFGDTVVSKTDWYEIGKHIINESQVGQDLYNEINVWVQQVIKDEECFTIIGV